MKSLEDYILGMTKDYEFKIRFLFEITQEKYERLEKRLDKYDVISMSPVEKTMFLKHAIGWTGPINSEVYIVDVKLGLPVSANHLRHEVANLFDVFVDKVSVSTDQEEEIKQVLGDEVYNDGALMDDPYYSEMPGIDSDDYYGDEYNKNMIKTIQDSRKDVLDKIFGRKYK